MENFVTESRKPAPGHQAVALLALTALALAIAACASPKKPAGPLLLHPLPLTVEKYSLSQGAILFSGPDFTVSARPWDYRLVAEESRSSEEPGPFGDSDEEVGRFLFFKVLLENRSTRTLVFNPFHAALMQQGEAPLLPLEISDLYVFAGEDSAAAETRARAFRRMSFDSTATVRPGQSIERYLVFRAPTEEVRQIALTIDELWLGSTSFDVTFPFEAFPGK